MDLKLVRIENPDERNLILGQSHFIKTVEDVHEALVNTVPGIEFGLAFCEASMSRLIRHAGTNEKLEALAVKNAEAIGAGHAFILFLKDAFPINVMGAIQRVPEVCRIFCATANPVQVVVCETDQGRGILGIVDGGSPLGVEGPDEVAARKKLLRTFGYKA